MVLTPARRRGHEILDDPSSDPVLAARSLRDIALANKLFGGRWAIVREVSKILRDHAPGAPLVLLDIGTGLGDIPAAARQHPAARHADITTIGLELTTPLASAARARCILAVTGDALALPFADGSIDIVTCSQVLHHFDEEPATALLRECTRVARHVVIIGDLRRSWLAVAGLWLSSFALGFHPVSRHDGVVSILRGFTQPELASLVERATGVRPTVRHAWGWRVTATWRPHISHGVPSHGY